MQSTIKGKPHTELARQQIFGKSCRVYSESYMSEQSGCCGKKKKKITVMGFAERDEACQAVMHLCSLTQGWEGHSSKLPSWSGVTISLENVTY